jgi:hypothetical protein
MGKDHEGSRGDYQGHDRHSGRRGHRGWPALHRSVGMNGRLRDKQLPLTIGDLEGTCVTDPHTLVDLPWGPPG